MTDSNFTYGKEMSYTELSEKIRRPENTLRVILARAEFNKFHTKRKLLINAAFCHQLYKFFELRKAKCHNIRSLERTQILLLKLAISL